MEYENFNSFGLSPELLQGVEMAGFREPTPIQQKAIPVVLEGRDLLGQALTGTGKTAAFGLPGMNMIQGQEGLNMLVLVPTRELAAQVSSELFKLGHFAGIKTAAFTGGQSYFRQEKLLREGINVLVATPGRLIDLMESGHFVGMEPKVIVVDEADEMLDMGFIDDIRKIFEGFSAPHQTMLFSATLPKQVVELAKTILNDPVDITTALAEATNNVTIDQSFFVIEEKERANAVIRLIDSENVTKCIIFCRTREETDALNILLGGRGYNVNCLHGDMEQAQRSRVMAAFRRGEIDIMVATDVAARGLDVDDISHVFNYHLPFDSRSYVHRIGRTGRAGKSGKAITLVTPRELRQLEAIRRTVGAEIQLGVIPTREEVKNQRLQKILAELFNAELDSALYNKILKLTLQQDQDPTILLTKMLSRELAGGTDQGPEHIGFDEEGVQEVIARNKMERKRRFQEKTKAAHERFARKRIEKRMKREGVEGGDLERRLPREERAARREEDRRERGEEGLHGFGDRKERGAKAKRASREERVERREVAAEIPMTEDRPRSKRAEKCAARREKKEKRNRASLAKNVRAKFGSSAPSGEKKGPNRAERRAAMFAGRPDYTPPQKKK